MHHFLHFLSLQLNQLAAAAVTSVAVTIPLVAAKILSISAAVLGATGLFMIVTVSFPRLEKPALPLT